MKTFLKWLLILGILTGGASAASFWAKSWWEQRSVPKYLTTTVSRGRVETVVNSTGTVKPVLSVSVGAFTSGPIAQVYVDFNSVVKKNQVLAIISPQLLEAAVERDQAAVESAEGRPQARRSPPPASQEQREPCPQTPGDQQGLSR